MEVMAGVLACDPDLNCSTVCTVVALMTPLGSVLAAALTATSLTLVLIVIVAMISRSVCGDSATVPMER